MIERVCLRCDAVFPAPIMTKVYCSERCRKAAEESRRLRRKRAARPPRSPRVPVHHEMCCDCGGPRHDWTATWGHPGSAGVRCRSCYNAAARARQTPS